MAPLRAGASGYLRRQSEIARKRLYTPFKVYWTNPKLWAPFGLARVVAESTLPNSQDHGQLGTAFRLLARWGDSLVILSLKI